MFWNQFLYMINDPPYTQYSMHEHAPILTLGPKTNSRSLQTKGSVTSLNEHKPSNTYNSRQRTVTMQYIIAYIAIKQKHGIDKTIADILEYVIHIDSKKIVIPIDSKK